jgi:hypothetical protein
VPYMARCGGVVCLGAGIPWLGNGHGSEKSSWFDVPTTETEVSSGHVHGILQVGRNSKGVYGRMDPVSCFTTGKSGYPKRKLTEETS